MKPVIKKLGKSWYIISEEDGLIGPYEKREMAVEDKRGLAAYEKHQDEPDFVCSENHSITGN